MGVMHRQVQKVSYEFIPVEISNSNVQLHLGAPINGNVALGIPLSQVDPAPQSLTSNTSRIRTRRQVPREGGHPDVADQPRGRAVEEVAHPEGRAALQVRRAVGAGEGEGHPEHC